MITPEELHRLLRRTPFQPFRLRLTDGRSYDVRYQDMNILGTTFVAVGIPVPGQDDPYCDHMEMVPLQLISEVQPLAQATEAASC